MPNSCLLSGNLTADPVRHLAESNGAVFATFRIAHTPRVRDRETSLWRDAETTTYISVTCWRSLAEHVLASLSKGDRVLVAGRLRQRDYTSTSGEPRSSIELDAETVAADLTTARVVVHRTSRSEATPSAFTAAPDPAEDDLETESRWGGGSALRV